MANEYVKVIPMKYISREKLDLDVISDEKQAGVLFTNDDGNSSSEDSDVTITMGLYVEGKR